MPRTNIPADSSKAGPDWGAALLVILGLALAVLVGLVVFRWSRDFFATTPVIQVVDAGVALAPLDAAGDAPALPAGAPPDSLPEPTALAADQETGPSVTVTPSAQAGSISAVEAPVPAPWNGTSQVTVLVMGLDYRDWLEGVDIPRTDTMILLAIDPLKKTAGMLSIPRDMWVNIPGFGYSRINTAYRDGEMYKLPGGGIGLAMKTVEQFTGVPVDYAALIDFNAFVKFIDELGGLDMHIRQEIKVDPIGPGNTRILEPGVQTLDGATALAYARNRYTQDGDFDRSKRQQEVIMALRSQILNFHQLPVLIQKAPRLYHELSSGIRTNLTLDQVIQLALLAAQVDEKNIKQGVFDPHKDVGYATVITKDGPASILVANPDQIRLLVARVFGAGPLGPSASGDLAQLMKAEGARVQVKNGTRAADQDQKAAELFRSQGVDAAGAGKAGTAYSQTTFIDHTGKPYTIQFMVQALNIPAGRIKMAFDPNASVDVEVNLGTDWKP